MVHGRLRVLLVAEVDAGDDLAAGDSNLISAAGLGLDPAGLRLFGDGVRAGGEVGEGVVATGIGDAESLAGVTAVVVVAIDVDRPARKSRLAARSEDQTVGNV